MECGPAHPNSAHPALFWTRHWPTWPMTAHPGLSCPRACHSAGHPAHLPSCRWSPHLWDSTGRHRHPRSLAAPTCAAKGDLIPSRRSSPSRHTSLPFTFPCCDASPYVAPPSCLRRRFTAIFVRLKVAINRHPHPYSSQRASASESSAE
jgi:hypothetical protein